MNEYLHKIRQIIVLRRKTMTLTPRTDFGEAQRLYFMPWLNRCSCFIKPHFFERRSDTAAAMSNPAPSEMRMTAGMKNWAFLTRRATQPKPAQIRITPARIVFSICLWMLVSAARKLLKKRRPPSVSINSESSLPEPNFSTSCLCASLCVLNFASFVRCFSQASKTTIAKDPSGTIIGIKMLSKWSGGRGGVPGGCWRRRVIEAPRVFKPI